MADLYAAKASGVENFERLVAIKIVRPPGGGDEKALREFIDMFVDEARLAGQLTHANIAQIYELGRFHQQLYIAMELVEGHNVVEVVNRLMDMEKPVPLPWAAYVISQAAFGLDYAHRREDLQGRPLNLVHRDVSPHNILLSYEGEVKIIDFGVAKATTNRNETTDGMLKGKIAYMAPEQIRTRQVDRRVDIFALGSVLYEMLAGRRLYQGADTIELLEKVRNADLPVLEETLPHVTRDLIAVLRNALAPDPERRYQTAADFAKALEPFLIYNRSIYGASEAAEVIRACYPDTPNRRRDYVNPSDSEIRDLGREFAPSVVEAFDKVASGRAPPSGYDPSHEGDGMWSKATTREYEQAVATGVRMEPPSRLHDRRGSGSQSGVRRAAEPAPPPRDPDYVEPQDISGIHEAFDGGPPQKKSPLPALALGALIALAGLGAWWFTVGPGAGPAEPVAAEDPKMPPAKTNVGYVTVTTKQGKSLAVFIDGKRVGRTPIELEELEYGTHQLTIAFKYKGKRQETRPQVIKVGEHNTRENPLKIEINDEKMPGE